MILREYQYLTLLLIYAMYTIRCVKLDTVKLDIAIVKLDIALSQSATKLLQLNVKQTM